MAEWKQEEPGKPDTKRDELKGKVLDLKDLVAYADGTVASRMVINRKCGSITIFSFDENEGLSEHSAPYDAILTVTDGEADVTIEGKPFTVRAGEMIILPANKPHGVQARQRFKMTLTMIRE